MAEATSQLRFWLPGGVTVTLDFCGGVITAEALRSLIEVLGLVARIKARDEEEAHNGR